MAKTQQSSGESPNPDLLAAVVLHTLVSKGRKGLSIERVARECERDPKDPSEMREIQVALDILRADGLAQTAGNAFMPSRAALRANELSF